MTVLVFGGNGQVGQELLRALSPLGEVVATTRSGTLPDGSACEVADFNQPDSLPALLDRLQPSAVINAAAYTAVDRAEQEPEAALRANAQAPGVIARWCAAHGVPLVHYSTDYVFDGQDNTPYREEEPTAPLGVYGTSKRNGEDAVRAAGGRHLIFRTSWVYATRGANFAKTMLRLAAEKETLSIINDQHGAPTGAELLADCTAIAIREELHNKAVAGTYHLVASGETSWYDYARFVFDVARANGVQLAINEVNGIPTTAYPTPAKRPLNSRLSNEKFQRVFGVTLPDWRQGVERVVVEVSGK